MVATLLYEWPSKMHGRNQVTIDVEAARDSGRLEHATREAVATAATIVNGIATPTPVANPITTPSSPQAQE